MLEFASDHFVLGRRYRVSDGGPGRLARVEYLRGDHWREARHLSTRELGHYLLHGSTHDPSCARLVQALIDSGAVREVDREAKGKRDLVVFESALYRGEPITHATIDGETTLCGRSGWETSEGWSDIGPDCLRCARALAASTELEHER